MMNECSRKPWMDKVKVSTYLAPETLRTSESRSRMVVLE